MIEEDQIPENFKQHLNEIAKQLWSGHAALMIGAGFSRNADPIKTNNKEFPDWNKLGDIFFKKLYGSYPTDKSYINILRLADEIEAEFGRLNLDSILKNEIPDKKFQPSLIHKKILQLPWTDVFTTNYDTLLERAAVDVTRQRFDIVTKQENLIYSTRPRIIKLHGSFPSKTPFIITEEDYRQYPRKFAPFVNTVQQSLLENTLCLIGFSGDDPNFLQWIGWIKDNLGEENSPNIYLIGILSLSESQKKLLIKRNIIPIDLSFFENVNGDHKKAISKFIEYLTLKNTFKESLNWPKYINYTNLMFEKKFKKKIIPILSELIEIRKKYPNWLILPEDRREVLQYNITRISFIPLLLKVETPIDIIFLYEYNWNIEKCLIPIRNDFIETYEIIINRYNPFPKYKEINNAITTRSKKDKQLDWNSIAIKWIEIQLSMLKYYRQNGNFKKWIIISDRLFKIINDLAPELKAKYYYERCLFHLFSFNIRNLKKELNSWSINNSLPYWEAKRAGLLAEIGLVKEAEKILEISLNIIRKRLNLEPIINDYSDISQEAYIMFFLKHVILASNFSQGLIKTPKELDQEYFDRRNVFTKYKCDPWSEKKIFSIQLDNALLKIDNINEEMEFVKYVENSYSFLKFIENIGIPYRIHFVDINIDIAEVAIKCIANYSPYWALVTCVRTQNLKGVNFIFGEKTIAHLNVETVDNLVSNFLSVLKISEKELINTKQDNINSYAISLSKVLPEVLSKLCIKSSFDVRIKLIDLLLNIYKSDFLNAYDGIRDLLKQLLNTFSDQELYKLIPKLLEFPILKDYGNKFVDPFYDVNIDINILEKAQKIYIPKNIIDNLFATSKKTPKERKHAIDRLIRLFKLNLLTKKQSNQLGKIIWSKTDNQNGFPIDINCYYFSLISYPHPKNINPNKLLKNYIQSSKFPVQSNNDNNLISMKHGDMRIIDEIIGCASNNISYKWNKKDIKLLIKKIINWWDLDKKYLTAEFSYINKEIINSIIYRFNQLVRIISNVLIKNEHLINESDKKKLKRVIIEFGKYNIPNLEPKILLYYLYPNMMKSILDEIHYGLLSKNQKYLRDALNALNCILDNKSIYYDEKKIINLVKIISAHIKNRLEIELDSFIYLIIKVIKNYPNLLNCKILENLEIGLDFLLTESIILDSDSEKTVSDKLIVKKASVNLSYTLYKYYKLKKIEIPEYINKWKDICIKENEFTYIRKIWIE